MNDARPKKRPSEELIAPLPRYDGRAEQGTQWGSLEEARLSGDTEAERAASEKLARRLVTTGRDWDVAVGLAYRALSLGAAKELRQELASWLELLGDHALAAAERRNAAAGVPEAAATMRRVALLHVRAEDAEGAREALVSARQADAKDAVAAELEGSLHAWAPEAVSAEEAANAFLEGAARRNALGQGEAEIDDLARAFDADPTSVGAAMGLAAALRRAARAPWADEIVRIHAVALLRKGERAASVALVQSEMQKMLAAGDLGAALGLMLDAESDAVVVGDEAKQFDDLLLRAGLLEAVAIRLEQRAKEQDGVERSSTLVELARVVSGSLADASRAFDAWGGALFSAPSSTILSALDELAKSDSDTRFEDALMDALTNDALDSPLRTAAAGKLLERAEERGLPELALFAVDRLHELDASIPKAAAPREKLEALARSRAEERSRALAVLENEHGDDRAAAIVVALQALRGVPGEEARRAALFAELARKSARDRGIRERAVHALVRAKDVAGAIALAGEVPDTAPEFVHFTFVAARLADAHGDTNAALERLMSALARAAPSERLASFAWILAARTKDAIRRARALAVLSALSSPSVSWVLASAAADQLGEHGETKLARATLEHVRQNAAAHPRLARAIVRVADEQDPAISELVEGLVSDRRNLAFLARARRASGDSVGALRAAAKLVAFRPGSQEAVELFADCLLATGEGSRIVDGLGWMLAQPLPAKTLAEVVARALHAARDLGAKKLVLVARRALDTLGPRSTALKDAVFAVAQRSKDDALAADLLERWAASGAPAGERPDTYLAVAECKRRAGDPNEEVRALCRALRSGASPDVVRPAIAVFDRAKLSPDGLLSYFEVKTLLAEHGKKSELVRALREYGAALWDLAGDRARALDVWTTAARTAPYRAYTALSSDVVAFAGQREGLRLIEGLVNRESDRARSGALAAEAARIALDAKQPERAMTLARIALERDSEHAESLCVAEEAAITIGRYDDLSALYDFVATRALGRFGRRAAHFRGARFFQTKAAPALSLRHAAQAFAAVPSEGGFSLLARAAQESGERSVAARTVETAADAQRSSRLRAAWLVRAAELCSDDEDGLRQQLDLLLRAVIVAEDRDHLGLLADAARALLVKSPDDREVVAMRLERAAKSLGKRMEGPEGARMALTFAELAVELEGDVERAWEHASRAMKLDADVDEYSRLEPASRRLAQADGALLRVKEMLDDAERPLANVGKAALAWLVTVARERGGDLQQRAEALLEKRTRASLPPAHDETSFGGLDDDDVLAPATEVSKAPAIEAASLEMPDPSEVRPPAPSVPDATSLDAAWDAPSMRPPHVSSTPPAVAIGAEVPPRSKTPAKLELLLSPDSERRTSARPPSPAALEPSPLPVDVSPVQAPPSHAPPVEDRKPEGDAVQVEVQRGVGRAQMARGEHEAAEKTWRDVLAAAPGDEEADFALEEVLAARDAHAELLGHLGDRVARWSTDLSKVDGLRALRLRRAALLEQRLGLVGEAAQELERVLEDDPEQTTATGYLADLYERMGKPKLAAGLLQRMLARPGLEGDERVEIAVRLARALLDGGDALAAESIVEVALAGPAPSKDALGVAARVYRACESHTKLSKTLVQLAAGEDPEPAHLLYLEAARASARAGDTDHALAHAQAAAKVAPFAADAQLLARGLEYRRRGSGTPSEAKSTIAELEPLLALGREDEVLRAFFLAEAQDALTRGAGQKTLRACVEQVGMHPLLAVAIAERDIKERRFEEATGLYDIALLGDLGGLRRVPTMLLAAADAALGAGDVAKALAHWRRAAEHADVRTIAERRIAEHSHPGIESEAKLEAPVAMAANEQTPIAPVVLSGGADRVEIAASGAATGAIPSLDGFVAPQTGSRADRAPLPPPSNLESPPQAVTTSPDPWAEPPAEEPEPAPRQVSSPSIAPMSLGTFEAREHAKTLAHPEERAEYLTRQASAFASRGNDEAAEELFFAAIEEGSLVAAEALARLLTGLDDRTGDLLRVRLLAVGIAPDPARLHAVAKAASQDRNQNLARAALHAAAALEGGFGDEEPPALAAQTPAPGVLRLLLPASRELEALGLVWRDASHLFAKRGASTIVSGMARLEPNAQTDLGRAYELALRLFELPRVPVLLEGGRTRNAEIALSLPPVVTLTCDESRSKDAIFALGEALALALPEHVLAAALPEGELAAIYRAIVVAFGSPREDKSFDRGSAALAEGLWSTLPPASQRRLRELADELDPRGAAPRAKHQVRKNGARLGLVLTGDLGHALRRRAAELGRGVASPSELRVRVSEDPELAELVKLAVLPEYADARWLQAAPASQRFLSGRFR